MYLPTNGANRDRTSILMSYRGTSVKAHSSREQSSDKTHLLSNSNFSPEESESPLEPFFRLANEIKAELARLNTSFDTLLKKQHECLRPTFTDSADSINEINTLTGSINGLLQAISQRINYITLPSVNDKTFPDRSKILANLRSSLLDSFREFSVKFKMAQQTFSASFNRRSSQFSRRKGTKIGGQGESEPFDFNINLGDEASQRRQQQLQEERNNEEIEQIARRAEEIRNIFLDLSNLIVEQGTVIDRIDFCVSESLNNAVFAHEEIEKAAEYQKKSRMWICAVVLAVMVLAMMVMAFFK